MKNSILLTTALVLTVLTGCRKLSPFPEYKQQGLSDDFFKLSASINGGASISENEGALTIPFNTPVKFNISEASRTIKNVEWIANGKKIAADNDAVISINDIGVYDLNVKFKETSSGSTHNRTLKLYVYKEITLSATITPNKNICGEVAIGITTESSNTGKFGPNYLLNSIQQICTTDTKKTGSIARVPIKIYDANTSISIDLIEPNKSTSTKTHFGFCFLFFCVGGGANNTVVNPLQVYQTDQFSASLTKNLKPGQYATGGTILTIE